MYNKNFNKTPTAFIDRKSTHSFINDITYTPSPEETAALERQVAALKAAKAAKAAHKAELAHRRKDAKAARCRSSADLEDGASVFSVASTSTYSSFRKMLSHKTQDKTAR
ncbi:hypothetical protein SEPCBS119000_001977 [Sporothrix epigloea]|uniref:Uncharacterized protein n=1 Tax=Sporothrix epigloea TaxID=1892477 RepID=A0ABP0DF96_9PEZI